MFRNFSVVREEAGCFGMEKGNDLLPGVKGRGTREFRTLLHDYAHNTAGNNFKNRSSDITEMLLVGISA
jgi:hypothetical protein